MVKCCVAPGCSRRQGRDNVSFYRFPSVIGRNLTNEHKTRRAKWIAAVRRLLPTAVGSAPRKTWEPSQYDRICSAHFISGQKSDDPLSPDFIPSVFCYKSSQQKKKAHLALHRYEKWQVTKEKMEENQKQQVAAQGLRLLAASGTQPIKEESMSSEDPQDNPDNSFDSDTCSITSGMLDHQVVQGAKDYSSLQLECQDLRAQLAESKTIIKHISVTEVSFQNNVDKVSYYTGLSSFGVLMVLVKLISPFLKRKCISPFQQLILTLSRLRLNLQIKDLSYRFGIHHSTVSRIFSDVIDILYVRLVPETIIWPEREEVKKTMPISFRETYPGCIGIIDCFEIFIEKSKDLKAKAQTWSNYKSHNTVKYLIAITPQGSISFISKGWGGRTSDKCLTDNSDLLNKLKPGDVLLADRGFDIKERMALYQCKVEIPAFTRGKKQLSMSEVQKTRELASQRIHVERVIGVLRNKYTLLQDTLPINMLQKDPVLNLTCVDKCVHVACALVNLSPSIVPSE